MKGEDSVRGSNRPVRKGSRVLHGPGDGDSRYHRESPRFPVDVERAQTSRGSILTEVLISLSIMGIAVLGVAAGGRATRLQAELASRRAAEALAAQQVLEQRVVWGSDDSPAFDTVKIGVHDVTVRTDVSDSLPGLVWLRVQADAGAGRYSWQLESARRIP